MRMVPGERCKRVRPNRSFHFRQNIRWTRAGFRFRHHPVLAPEDGRQVSFAPIGIDVRVRLCQGLNSTWNWTLEPLSRHQERRLWLVMWRMRGGPPRELHPALSNPLSLGIVSLLSSLVKRGWTQFGSVGSYSSTGHHGNPCRFFKLRSLFTSRCHFIATASTQSSLGTMVDVPLYVVSDYASSERRITPSWSISQLKAKLESITGIPPSCQRIFLKTSSNEKIAIEAPNEDAVYLQQFPLTPYADLVVVDTRPVSARPNLSSTAGVEKFVLPEEEYEKKTDSVLAWKKAQKLGRFDPNAPSHEQAKIAAIAQEIEARGIAVGKRCRVGEDDTRRGEIKYVGDVPEIPGLGAWVGVQLDEPVGKNDGGIGGTRYWGEESQIKRGIFVRPERVEVGDFPVLDYLEDMEEI